MGAVAANATLFWEHGTFSFHKLWINWMLSKPSYYKVEGCNKANELSGSVAIGHRLKFAGQRSKIKLDTKQLHGFTSSLWVKCLVFIQPFIFSTFYVVSAFPDFQIHIFRESKEREPLNWSDCQGSVLSLSIFSFHFLTEINIHFRVPRDNICHSSPQAYSDWACRVNRAKLTQISQGRPGTLWRGMRLFSSRFRQGRGLLLAHLSHTETDEKWKVKGILFRNGWFVVVNTPFKRHRGLSGRGR